MSAPARARNTSSSGAIMLMPGDCVEVLPARELLATLGEDGTLEGLPFMPEMLPYCGRTFRVLVRAEVTCARGLPPGQGPLRRLDGAVVLEGLRCDGAAHGGCQLGCMLFWKERWVRRAAAPPRGPEPGDAQPAPELRVTRSGDPTAYVCQGTELARATRPADPIWSPGQYARMLRVGTLTVPRMAAMFARMAGRKVRRAVGTRLRRRPVAQPNALGLQPGEWVHVRSGEEILATLDGSGAHKGLGFSNDMYAFCGRKMKVARRVETIVAEETGRLRRLRDTVVLEGGICERYRGCARGMPLLWREAWLERVDPRA